MILGKVKVHRVNNVYELPVAERRKERILKDDGFDAPEAEEVIEDDNEDDVIRREEELAAPNGMDAADAEEVSAGDRLLAQTEVPSGM